MKLAKISLMAILLGGMSSSLCAADTLADAFKNGQVNGELKAYFFDRKGDVDTSTSLRDSSIFTTGVMLSYKTDSLYGFQLGTTVQTSSSPFASGAIGQVGTAKDDFKFDMYGSGAVLSEAYVQYTLANTTAKVGRQFLFTPLVAGGGLWVVSQAFEGAIVTNTDLPQTTLMGGVITKHQLLTDWNGHIPDFQDLDLLGNTDGGPAYTLLVINKSIPNITLTGQWLDIHGDNTMVGAGNFYYLEAAYNAKIADWSYGLAVNSEYKDTEMLNEKDGKMYGAKVSFGYGDLNTYVAYSKITKDGNIEGTLGGLSGGLGNATQTVFAAALTNKAGTYRKDTSAYAVDANYLFKSCNFLVGARYVTVDDNAQDKDFAYMDLYTSYKFSGALKGFSTDISYQDYSKDADGHDFWFKAVYKF